MPFSSKTPKPFFTLAAARQMTSLIERELLLAAPPFVRDTSDWVKLWYDPGNAKTSECGQMTAYRAVTDGGRTLWFVFTPRKARGYHALTDCHIAAMDMARRAWAQRRAVRADWPAVEALARELRLGRVRLDVRMDDAERSPLCTLGIEGFLRGVGLGRVRQISGRLAAWLMLIEPQMGFVLHEAALRQRAAGGVQPLTAALRP
ncbi:MAG: hypothetical protein AAGF60_02590 [Pseudomonadota bacterium]